MNTSFFNMIDSVRRECFIKHGIPFTKKEFDFLYLVWDNNKCSSKWDLEQALINRYFKGDTN